MAKKGFYRLSLREKTLICIGAFFTILSGLNNLDQLLEKYYSTPSFLVKTIAGLIFLLLGALFTYFILYANSIFPYLRLLICKLKKDESKIVISSNEFEDRLEQSKEYKSELGEIAAYWGNRNAANNRIKDLLKSTKANEIFIAAIGFSTIQALDDTEVISHFANLINDNNCPYSKPHLIR